MAKRSQQAPASEPQQVVMAGSAEATAPTVAPIQPMLLDEERAALVLTISPRKLWELSASGAIKHIKIGSLKRYRLSDLEEWVANGCPTE